VPLAETFVPVDPVLPLAGTTVPGYEILEELGHGGMGVVYRARQLKLGRIVALKMILAGSHAGAEELHRFRTEAEAIARLQHPNIVQVFEVGECQGGPFFSLEFCGGGSLGKKLGGTPLTPREAVLLVEALARGMHAAHQHGVIHRDLKPANVLLAEDGTPKITDFGLAKKLDQAGQTQVGSIMGTPSYMAPEQAAGKSAEVGPASDVYALGAILYECLTGRPPFRAATPLDTVLLVVSQEPVAPSRLQPGLPRDLETICLKCLEKEPRKRYASALELAEDLRRFQAGEPTRARPVGVWGRGLRWAKRRPAAAALVAVCTLAVAGLVAGVSVHSLFLGRALRIAEERRVEADSRLYDSLIGEARALRLARVEGYRTQAWQRLRQAAQLMTPNRDADQLRREATDCLGDYLGLGPAGRLDFPAEVSVLAPQADGPLLAVGLKDGTVCLRHLDTGQEIARLSRHPSSVTALAFAPGGKRLLAGHAASVVQLWESNAGAWQPRRRLASKGKVGAVAWDARGTPLAVSFARGAQLRLWDVAEGKHIATFMPPGKEELRPALSPDGSLLAVGYRGQEEKGICVWDISTRQVRQTLRPQLDKVRCVGFSPDGRHLLCGCELGVALYDTAEFRRRFFVGGDLAGGVALHADSGLLAFFSPNTQAVRLWDVGTNREEAVLNSGRAKRITSVALSGDGRRILLAHGHFVEVWDRAATREKRVLPHRGGGVPDLAFSPDGKWLAVASKDRRVRVWDVATGTLAHTLLAFRGPAHNVVFSPDSSLLAAADWGGSLRVWHTANWKLAADLPVQQDVWSLAFHPKGTLLAAAGSAGVRVWAVERQGNPPGGRVVLRPLAQPSAKRSMCVSFSPNGRTLAWDNGNPVRLWDTARGKELSPLPTSVGISPQTLAFLPDGRLALVNWRKEIEVWDVVKRRRALTLGGRNFTRQTGITHGRQLVPSPDGARLAVSGNRVTVWDLARRKLLLALPEERGDVWALAWSPDGKLLATGSSDGALVIWDLPRVKAQLAEIGLDWEDAGR
jgi:WD40 repeat protein